MLKIHETTEADGSLAPISLARRGDDGALVLVLGATGEECPLPPEAISAVMARYGKPVEPTEDLIEVGALDLADGCRIRHVRHLARYDVIARDFLVFEQPGRGQEPLCALATTVAGALTHLARAASGSAG